eukprot:10818794-Heterocapsa_arctica.AAC.1
MQVIAYNASSLVSKLMAAGLRWPDCREASDQSCSGDSDPRTLMGVRGPGRTGRPVSDSSSVATWCTGAGHGLASLAGRMWHSSHNAT